MIDITDKSKCCGCGTCGLVCPQKCISMGQDKAGFLFPQVDASICIQCGRCNQVCPLDNIPESEEANKEVYVAFATDRADRFTGSSGGVFGTVAQWVISQKGVVLAQGLTKNLS